MRKVSLAALVTSLGRTVPPEHLARPKRNDPIFTGRIQRLEYVLKASSRAP
jgi:hypothetical protein